MPPSNDLPAAIVCTAERAEEPDDAGRLPPAAEAVAVEAEVVAAAAATAVEATSPSVVVEDSSSGVEDLTVAVDEVSLSSSSSSPEEEVFVEALVVEADFARTNNPVGAANPALIPVGKAAVAVGKLPEPAAGAATLPRKCEGYSQRRRAGVASVPMANAKRATEMYCILNVLDGVCVARRNLTFKCSADIRKTRKGKRPVAG